MYKRILSTLPKKIIQNGNINFGSFQFVTPALDIRGVRSPFTGIPSMSFFPNFRIKSKLSYLFLVDEYIGKVEFFDDKAFGIAEVIFWNRETNKKLAYHKIMGPRRRFIPINTEQSACISFGKTRYMKISWSKERDRISMSFVVKGDGIRPSAKGLFEARFCAYKDAQMLYVNPAPISKRCSATWLVPMQILGGIATAKHRHYIKEIPHTQGLALMTMNRTYLGIHSNTENMTGLVTIDGKNIIFHFENTDYDSIDSDQYNNNLLTINGETTALPSVTITHPFGLSQKWIVQDTENMVDMTFYPLSVASRTWNILVMRNAYTTIYGNFEGTLMDKNGEKITFKNCPGIVKKSILRL